MFGSVVIVGSSIAGVSAADVLRERGFTGRVIVIGSEDRLPYDRPPLTKGLLTGKVTAAAIALHNVEHYVQQNIELVLGSAAVALDPKGPAVQLADGRVIPGDCVIIATGATACRLRGSPGSDDGVFTVRDLDDGLKLRSSLLAASNVAVIGGGFIGAEVASSAAELGRSVTIVEAEHLPLLGRLGPAVAAALNAAHLANGVDVRTDTLAQQIFSVDSRHRVAVSPGAPVDADLVVVGLGVTPNTEWLAGSGVKIDDGVICDEFGRTSVTNVYAIGDVAAWRDPRSGRFQRIEHWTNAKEQARLVASNLVAGDAPQRAHEPVPYVWSDQHGHRLQVLGWPDGGDETVVVHGALDAPSFVVLYVRDEHVSGAAGRDAVAQMARLRKAVAESAPLSDFTPFSLATRQVAS